MRLRYAGQCACGVDVPAGTRAGYDSATKMAVCPDCLVAEPAPKPPEGRAPEPEIIEEPAPAPDDSPVVDAGKPGSSLRREYERRRDRRETRIRENHKYLGGVILALSNEPASTRAFAVGADGEERLAARLERDCSPQVLFLHNRKLGRGRRDGDIDHIAISATGVYVIDAKRYPGSIVRVRRSGGLVSPVQEQLMIAGRDRSKLLAGCAKQVDAVNAALAGFAGARDVAVAPMLCFIDADLPLLSRLEIGGVRILGPKAVIKVITAEGGLDAETRAAVHQHLSLALPPA